MANLKKIGSVVKSARLERQMSQQALAKKVGVHFTYIGHIERSKKTPSLNTFCRIAKALSIPAEKLLALC